MLCASWLKRLPLPPITSALHARAVGLTHMQKESRLSIHSGTPKCRSDRFYKHIRAHGFSCITPSPPGTPGPHTLSTECTRPVGGCVHEHRHLLSHVQTPLDAAASTSTRPPIRRPTQPLTALPHPQARLPGGGRLRLHPLHVGLTCGSRRGFGATTAGLTRAAACRLAPEQNMAPPAQGLLACAAALHRIFHA